MANFVRFPQKVTFKFRHLLRVRYCAGSPGYELETRYPEFNTL